jgi:hypothetical protein
MRALTPYAGIGSRATPARTLEQIEALGARFAREGLVLRTGASPGADQAFMHGAAKAGGRAELYLPCPRFEAGARAQARGLDAIVLGEPAPRAYDLAARFHPAWEELGERERRLRARDVHQVLGADLRSPVEFVVCWTPDGRRDGTRASAGGTGQALRVAASRNIPVINLADTAAARLALERLPGARPRP